MKRMIRLDLVLEMDEDDLEVLADQMALKQCLDEPATLTIRGYGYDGVIRNMDAHVSQEILEQAYRRSLMRKAEQAKEFERIAERARSGKAAVVFEEMPGQTGKKLHRMIMDSMDRYVQEAGTGPVPEPIAPLIEVQKKGDTAT